VIYCFCPEAFPYFFSISFSFLKKEKNTLVWPALKIAFPICILKKIPLESLQSLPLHERLCREAFPGKAFHGGEGFEGFEGFPFASRKQGV
jgi:hypothetical protein